MASKRHKRRQECGRKKPYSDVEEAWRVCRGQAFHEGRKLSVYKCPWSGGSNGPLHYHICHVDKHMENPHGSKFAS